jgi:signal transduction histidine kinase
VPVSTADVFASGGGELGELIRSIPAWKNTSLGPPSTWPPSLRTTLRLMLTSRYAMWMGWGPELLFFYNDAYREQTLGKKHPWALGKPAREVWAEIWDTIGPRVERVLSTGEATWDEGLLLFLERHGFPEETYHTFSYSPAPGDDGGTEGLFCVVIEETERVIGERRLALLRDLAVRFGTVTTIADVMRALEQCLVADSREFPFSLTYLFDEHGATARRVATTFVGDGHPAAPAVIDVGEPGGSWPLRELLEGGEARVVALDADAGWPKTGWGKAPSHAIVLPLAQSGQGRPAGAFIAGLNPYRPVDDAVRSFAGLFAGQLTASISSARAREEELRRAEALAEIDRAKTTFFSNVSHEFRTPLTLMLGPLEDALASAERTLSGDNLEMSHRNALRLLRLVNALLDFSRIEAGRVQASYERTDVAQLTSELASVFRSAVERAGLRLRVDARPVDAPVFVDREMWEKIVLNLLSNALKFTFEGTISVGLHADGPDVVLTVADTGTGVPAAEIPHLFKRFHRVHGARARTHEGSGSGIGLALVSELVKLHGGDVRATSVEGKGTTFEVRIPTGSAHLSPERIVAERRTTGGARAAAPFVEEAMRWIPSPHADGPAGVGEDDGPRASAQGRAAKPSHPSARIVVADDNADMREYVARLLGTTWQVEAVNDGIAALEAVRRHPPALVLSDVMMPRLDGFGLVRALRDDLATRTIPIILLSARAGEESTSEGLRAGANDYLIKPFSSRELMARVTSQLTIAAIREESERAQVHARLRAELGSRVGRALVTGESLADQLRRSCEAIVGMGAALARIWVYDPGHETFELRASAAGGGVTDVADLGTESHDVELVASIGRQRKPTFVRAAAPREGDAPVFERPWAKRGGIVTYAGHPLLVGDRLVGVVELFAGGDLPDDLATALSTVADPIALGIDRDASERFRELFIGMLGHDLRNPLNAVLMAMRVLAPGATAAQQRTLQRVENSARRMERMISQVLDFTRARSGGGIPIARERADLRVICEQTVEELATAHPARTLELKASGDARGAWDADRMTQVFSNLISNALSYGRPDAPVLVAVNAADTEVEVTVQNFGPPIPAEMLPRLFDPFRRAHHAKHHATQGLGLGLFISKQIIGAHGGSISVRSADSSGTLFTVTLPKEAVPT